MTKPKMADGAKSPGTLKTFFYYICKIWILELADGDYSLRTHNLT